METDESEPCQRLLARGIGVEAGLSQAAQVDCTRGELSERCLRILIEPTEEEPGADLETTTAIIQALDAAWITLPHLLH